MQYCGTCSSISSPRVFPQPRSPSTDSSHAGLLFAESIGIHWRGEHVQGFSLMHNKDTQQCTWSTPGGGLALRYTPPHSCWSRMSSHGRGVGDMHRVKIHRESYRLYLIYLYCFAECALHVHSLLKNISPTVQDDSKQTLTLCAAVLCKLRLSHNPLIKR